MGFMSRGYCQLCSVSFDRLLVECLVDSGKWKEACSFAKATSDFIESQAPDLYPKIFSLQVKPGIFQKVLWEIIVWRYVPLSW